MVSTIVDVVLAAVGLGVLTLVVVTVWLVARNRPSRPPLTRGEASRPVPRSMRGWQAFAVREIRRRGRSR